jgi:hypothetical protein
MLHSWKFVAGVCLFVILAVFPCRLPAQSEASPKPYHHYSAAELADEPPFTQQEMDAYAEILIHTEYAAYNEPPRHNQAFLELLKTRGFSHKRFYFLTTKLSYARSLAIDGEIKYVEGYPDSLKVTPKEAAIVEKSWEKLVPPDAQSLKKTRELMRGLRERQKAQEEEKLAKLAQEPPLTQADVDAWLYFETGFDETYAPISLSDTEAQQETRRELKAKLQALLAKTGLTKTHHLYITDKVATFTNSIMYELLYREAIGANADVPLDAGANAIIQMYQDEADARLNAEEKALLQKNQDRIMTLYRWRMNELP